MAPPPRPAAPAPPLVIPPALGPRRVDIRIYGQVRVLVDGQELVKALPDAGRQVLALLTVRGELTEDEIVELAGGRERRSDLEKPVREGDARHPASPARGFR